MKAHPVPKVGDTVVLNDTGLRQIFNRTLGLGHMKTLRMKVTQVDAVSMTIPSPCVKQCELDEGRQHCIGCGRTVQEIGSWRDMSDDDRQAVLARLNSERQPT